MKLAHGHIAAFKRSCLQRDLAALLRATALAKADVRTVYEVADRTFGNASQTSFLTYYSYRYL